MARLRWASGIAIVALTTAGCGMGGGDEQRRWQAAARVGGGHLVYAEQFAPAAAWALETNDAHR